MSRPCIEKIAVHDTDQEINFIKKLGSHSKAQGTESRLDLLKRYLAACDKRKDWGEIKRSEVMNYARQLVFELHEQNKAA